MNRGLARRRNPRRLDTHSFLTTAAFARPTPGPPVPCKTWRGTQSGAGDTQRGKRGREILSPQPKSPGFFPVSIWAADIGATGRFRLEKKVPQLQKRIHTQGNHKTGEECRMQEVYGPRSGLEKERGRGLSDTTVSGEGLFSLRRPRFAYPNRRRGNVWTEGLP